MFQFSLNEIHVCLVRTYDRICGDYFAVDLLCKAFLTVNNPLKFVPSCAPLNICCSEAVVLVSKAFDTGSVMCLCHIIYKGSDRAVVENTKRGVVIFIDAKTEFRLVCTAVCIIVPCSYSDIAHLVKIYRRGTC